MSDCACVLPEYLSFGSYSLGFVKHQPTPLGVDGLHLLILRPVRVNCSDSRIQALSITEPMKVHTACPDGRRVKV